MVHVVVREIVAARARRADPAHGAGQEAARGIAHHDRQPPPAAIGANNAETLDVVKTGIVGAVLAKGEAEAGQKNLVDESLRIAGNPMFQTGNENTIASAARRRLACSTTSS